MANDAAISIALKFLDQATAPMQQAMEKMSTSAKAMQSVVSGVAGVVKGAFVSITAGLSVSKALDIGKEYQEAMVRVKNVFQDGAESAATSLELISARSKYLFDFPELAQGAAKIKDITDLMDISDQEMMVFLTRVTDVAKAKGIQQLEEAISKVNMAFQGSAKAARQTGTVINDTYMQYEAFGGALKDLWANLSAGDKYWWRQQEWLVQTSKYSNQAATDSSTLSGAIKALGNTLAERLEPALARVCDWLAKYINLTRQAIAPDSLSSQIQSKMVELQALRKPESVENIPISVQGFKSIMQQAHGTEPETGPVESDLYSLRARLRGERAGKEALQPTPLTKEGLPVDAVRHMAQLDKGAKVGGGGGGGRSTVDDGLREHQRIMAEGLKIEQSTFDATQKYSAELEKLKYYLDYNAISQDTFNKAAGEAWDVLVKAAQATDGYKESIDIQKEMGSVFDETRTSAENYAKEVERLNYLYAYTGSQDADTYLRKLDQIGKKWGDTSNEMSEFAVQAARNIQDALGDQLYNMMTGKFDDIGTAWLQLIAKMVSQAVAAQIGNALFGNFGQSKEIGGVFGALIKYVLPAATAAAGSIGSGGSYSGLNASGYSLTPRAQGGPIAAHKTYLVGERGPEIFMSGSIGGSSIPLTFGGTRASGGPVDHHKVYLVGERGPEIFKAHESGLIVPNHMISTSNALSAVTHSSVSNISNFGGMRAAGGPVKRDSVYVVGERGPELYLPSPSRTQVAPSPASASRAPSVNLTINNNTGQKIEQDSSDVKFDGEAYHVNVSLKAMKNNAKYRDSMKQMINGR